MSWQPIDTAPKVEDQQILVGKSGEGAALVEWRDGRWGETLGGGYYGTSIGYEPTHWMPIQLIPGTD